MSLPASHFFSAAAPATPDTTDWVNTTHVQFDDRLISAIDRLHLENPGECMRLIMSSRYEDIVAGQLILRNWFVANQFLFNVSGRLTCASRCMPDFYALLCANLCVLGTCQSWADVSAQIAKSNRDKHKTVSDAVLFCDFDDDTETVLCACSHSVRADNSFILKNHGTGRHVLLGCDCGCKLGIVSSAEFKKMKKPDTYERLTAKRLRESSEKKKATARHLKVAHMWAGFSKRIATLVKTHRPCIGCERRCIAKTEPRYAIRCKPCYFRFKNPNYRWRNW